MIVRLAALILIAGSAALAQETPATSAENPIDASVNVVWRREGVVPADRSEDAEFLRRVTLDLTGRLPTPEETAAFLAERTPDKREKKIDALMASPAFTDFWAARLSGALIGKTPAEIQYYINRAAFENWMRERLRARVGWDVIVTELLTSDGLPGTRAEGTFLSQFTTVGGGQITLKVDDAAGKVSSAFLGIRLRCAQCHDHPQDKYTQEDFHSLAAFFRGAPQMRVAGVPPLKIEGQMEVAPKLLGLAPPKGGLRQGLARLLIGHEQFARAFVNRLWAYLFGRGIVHPYDDFNPQRRVPALEVLDAVARELRARKFDIRWLLRTIATSRVYQRTSRGANDRAAAQLELFARARTRPLTPEQLWNAITQATQLERASIDKESMERLGLPAGPREQNYATLRQWFLELLTKGTPPDQAESLTSYTSNHQLVLQFMNFRSPIWAGLRAGSWGRLHRVLRANREHVAVLNELFMATLSRRSTSAEQQRLLRHVGAMGREPGFSEVFWVILNSDEFVFNH